MDNNEYLRKALALDRSKEQYAELISRFQENHKLVKLLHSVLGMSGEIGEATDTVKKSIMYGKEIDVENLKEECGDILWYMSVMVEALGSSFEEVMHMNIEKLSKRYPNGFTEKDAQARRDKTESRHFSTGPLYAGEHGILHETPSVIVLNSGGIGGGGITSEEKTKEESESDADVHSDLIHEF